MLKHISYNTSGTCAKKIDFDLSEDGKIFNLKFTSGCPGNLSAISRLLEGQNALDVANILEGNTCGPRNTSCADQLSKAIKEAINE